MDYITMKFLIVLKELITFGLLKNYVTGKELIFLMYGKIGKSLIKSNNEVDLNVLLADVKEEDMLKNFKVFKKKLIKGIQFQEKSQ